MLTRLIHMSVPESYLITILHSFASHRLCNQCVTALERLANSCGHENQSEQLKMDCSLFALPAASVLSLAAFLLCDYSQNTLAFRVLFRNVTSTYSKINHVFVKLLKVRQSTLGHLLPRQQIRLSLKLRNHLIQLFRHIKEHRSH